MPFVRLVTILPYSSTINILKLGFNNLMQYIS